ncbi:MAG: hypothetical protein J6J04_05535 [Oscillospiraceae bacterium]|nr:hypothetical protein [Oscillospiraceae bacterium]
MKNFNEMEQELLRSGKADKVKAIADSPDGQKLMQKLDAGKIERAVQSGDSDALRSVLMDVLRTGEGQRLAKQLEQTMREK